MNFDLEMRSEMSNESITGLPKIEKAVRDFTNRKRESGIVDLGKYMGYFMEFLQLLFPK